MGRKFHKMKQKKRACTRCLGGLFSCLKVHYDLVDLHNDFKVSVAITADPALPHSLSQFLEPPLALHVLHLYGLSNKSSQANPITTLFEREKCDSSEGSYFIHESVVWFLIRVQYSDRNLWGRSYNLRLGISQSDLHCWLVILSTSGKPSLW